MRRTGLALLCMLGLAAVAAAEPIRIELGLGGVFPVGQWTRCRVSGLDEVKEGAVILVRVGEEFETEMNVAGGRAEGLILVLDESPAITLEVPGKGRVALSSEARGLLRGVKDKLPAIFLSGDNLPEEQAVCDALAAGQISPIRMTTEEFFRDSGRGVEWVRVFVLGRMRDEDVERLRDRFSHLSGSVIVAKPGVLTGWLDKLAFENVGGLSVYNRSLAQLLPVPRASVRPELYEIFGPPKWPKSVRRNITVGFVVSLGFFALAMVFPRRKGKRWGMSLGSSVFATALLTFIASWHISAPPESVSLVEVPEGAEKGVETTFISQAVLTSSSGGLLLNDVGIPLSELNPVASYPTQWVEHKFFLDRRGRLERDWPVPSREVFVRFSYSPVPATADTDSIMTDGEDVIPCKINAPGVRPSLGKTCSLTEYLASWQHKDPRVDELRHGVLKYWHKYRRREGFYCIIWTEPAADGKVFSAGTMMVFKGIMTHSNPSRSERYFRPESSCFSQILTPCGT